ncbi:TetR/AcrR family transcriptional regulator [Cupriavidus plantarum]|uniref:TetR family transcriptional regulator n=1 Tax=Cupriavidus plantarum TaxID=942865 RepID=A0A316ER89_9BURK|nr:TetR/AcrR family transcriptional regulator [Cupriavidus plantarum]NYI01946.1 TetR/AcrR family transcriptional repressor of nem operon [Cupriavidus plantarum]PWK34079.1 TetR family transcriptional regulator [Cupriavidus plantarum]REE91252.1 TetR family transcriptional regulator [Cupriavidus plantarum]RLK31607.1 TetR family transcriptional regulator [Cupriavidus plantarum]CAG2147087.1 hypothetical protein LMG26296_04025 [Cupriavidus plantarum]
MATSDTKQRILTIARGMVQAHGYNALSFRDIAQEIGIKGPAVHHHFTTKGDLGAALARTYTDDAIALLEDLLLTSHSQREVFDRYIAVFRAALENGNRMCLCGIMSAELEDLPEPVRVEVNRFTDVNIAWLTRLLALGGDAGADKVPEDARRRRALAIFTAIEGAQLVARGHRDVAMFDRVIAAYREAGLCP